MKIQGFQTFPLSTDVEHQGILKIENYQVYLQFYWV